MRAKKLKAARSLRAKLRSPGRPPVLHRAERLPFWKAIAKGHASEDAAGIAGVSQAVGNRWFRQCGGMPPSNLAPSAPEPTGRYLSFAEREQIAAVHLHARAVAVRPGERPLRDAAIARHDVPRVRPASVRKRVEHGGVRGAYCRSPLAPLPVHVRPRGRFEHAVVRHHGHQRVEIVSVPCVGEVVEQLGQIGVRMCVAIRGDLL